MGRSGRTGSEGVALYVADFPIFVFFYFNDNFMTAFYFCFYYCYLGSCGIRCINDLKEQAVV